MPDRPPRDVVKKSTSKGDAERALHVDDMAMKALLALMANEPIEEGHKRAWPLDMIPASMPENTGVIEQLQGARFGPTQALFDQLRSNPSFQAGAKQDTMPNQFFEQRKQ